MSLRDTMIETMMRKERLERWLHAERCSLEFQLRELRGRLLTIGRHGGDKRIEFARIPAIQGEVNEISRVLTVMALVIGRIEGLTDAIDIEEDLV